VLDEYAAGVQKYRGGHGRDSGGIGVKSRIDLTGDLPMPVGGCGEACWHYIQCRHTANVSDAARSFTPPIFTNRRRAAVALESVSGHGRAVTLAA
jgi:hypothetical protein